MWPFRDCVKPMAANKLSSSSVNTEEPSVTMHNAREIRAIGDGSLNGRFQRCEGSCSLLYLDSTLPNTIRLQTGILQLDSQRRIMAESLVYKPRMDLSNNMLFRLSLYHMYVPSVVLVSSFGPRLESHNTCLEGIHPLDMFEDSLLPLSNKYR